MRPNQVILDRFWALSEVNPEKRLSAVKGLVLSLKDESAEVWLYCLERLLKGLASSRAAARLGFSVALVELLSHSEEWKLQFILDAVEKNLPLKESEDAKGNALGQVLALQAIVKSGKFNENDQFGAKIAERLSQLISSNRPLDLICYQGLLHLCRPITKENFKSSIWPHLKQLCKADPSDWTASSLWFLLEISRLHPHLLKKKIAFETTSVLSGSVQQQVASLLMETTKSCPVQHPLVKSIFEVALASDVEDFRRFWKNVVENVILTSDDLGNKVFVIQIVVGLLTGSSLTTEQIPVVLSDPVMKQFMKMLLHPKHSTSSKFVQLSASSLLEAILSYSEKLKSDNKSDQQIELLTAIFNVCSNFDRVTSTHLVGRTIRTLLPAATDFCFEHSVSILTAESSAAPLSTTEASAILKEFQLLFETSHDVECSEAKLKTLKMLGSWTLHGLGATPNGKLDTPMPHKSLLQNEKVLEVATAVFSSCVESFCFKLIRNHSFHLNQSSLKILSGLVSNFIKTFVSKEEATNGQIHKWKFSQKDRTLCQKAMDTVKKLNKSGDSEGKSVGFRVLLIGGCLACLVHQSVDSDFIQEVLTCLEKSDQPVKENSDEPHWLDVLIDLLLSVLAKPARLLRTVIQVAFKYFVPFLQDTSLEPVLKAIDPRKKEVLESEDDDEMEDFRNGAESQTSQSEQSGATDDNEVEFESESEAHSSDEEEEEEITEGEVDPHLADAVRKALGEAAAVGRSDEDDSGPELDDEAMMRLDQVIADAFKQNIRGKKPGKLAQQQEVINFRIRCFDLIFLAASADKPNLVLVLVGATVYKLQCCGLFSLDYVQNLLTPLVSFADAAGKFKGQEKIVERCRNLIHIIVHTRKMESIEQTDLVVNVAKSLIEETKHIANPFLQADIGDIIAFLYKVSDSSQSIPAQSLFKGFIDDCLKEFMADRQSPVHYRIISSLFLRFPVDFSKFLPELVDFAFDDNIRSIRRTESCSLIELFLNGRIVNEATDESMKHWKKFIKRLGKNVQTYIKGCLDNFEGATEESTKPRYFAQLVQMLVKLVNVKWSPQFDLGVFVTEEFVAECLEPFTSPKMWNKSKIWTKVMAVLSRVAKRPAHKVFAVMVTSLRKRIKRQESAADVVPNEVMPNGHVEVEESAPPAKKRKE